MRRRGNREECEDREPPVVAVLQTAASRLWDAVVAVQMTASHSEAMAEVVRAVIARDTANVSRRT